MSGGERDERLQIVHIIRDLDVASGGPSRSVPALARTLARSGGVSVSLLYQDRGNPVVSLPDDGVDYRAVPAGDLILFSRLARHLCPDAVREGRCLLHIHGLWSPTLHRVACFARRRGIPYLVSTRGMLASWSLRHKSLKKKIAWRLYQRRDLLRAACLVATSEEERADVTALLPGAPVAMIPNGCEPPPAAPAGAEVPLPLAGERLALAMGRLHPVKGFAELIEAWGALRPAGWCLAIAGPDEGGYRARLEELIVSLSLEGRVHLVGPLDDREKWGWLHRCDLFVAPSRTENFGMAIVEAMLAGKPVLTTTGTPWGCLPEIGAGWWVPPTPEGLKGALREATGLPDAARQGMGARAGEYAQRYSPEGMARQLKELYLRALAGKVEP